MKDCFPDSRICQDVHLKRMKLAGVIRSVLAPCHSRSLALAEQFNTNKLSLIADESTDISCNQNICIGVRYFDERCRRIVSSFWDLCRVFTEDRPEVAFEKATANHLYNTIMSSFRSEKVNLENLIGFGLDGCNTMQGEHNSVSSRLQANFPGISNMKCICHSLAICSNEAVQVLPC